MPDPNTFAGARIDRAGPRRADPGWVEARMADPGARAVVVTLDGAYLEGDALARPPLATAAELAGAPPPVLLGVLATGAALFAVDAAAVEPELARAALAPAAPAGLRDAAARLSDEDAGLVAYASGMLNWHRRHRFCANCGAVSEPREAGHVRTCPACGASHHPRTDPVVIMLVTDGDRVVLGRQHSWPAGRYSALAGFVEPGESLESAVAREVREEAGVEVADVRYASSQPWPFPGSLMLGFFARHVAGEPATSDDEFEDVRWFTRAEVTAAIAGEGELHVPPPIAIARRLIDAWIEEG